MFFFILFIQNSSSVNIFMFKALKDKFTAKEKFYSFFGLHLFGKK